MSKRPPPNTPNVGDMCRWRGRGRTGKLYWVDSELKWAKVEWDDGNLWPIICHLFELEKV